MNLAGARSTYNPAGYSSQPMLLVRLKLSLKMAEELCEKAAKTQHVPKLRHKYVISRIQITREEMEKKHKCAQHT